MTYLLIGVLLMIPFIAVTVTGANAGHLKGNQLTLSWLVAASLLFLWPLYYVGGIVLAVKRAKAGIPW